MVNNDLIGANTAEGHQLTRVDKIRCPLLNRRIVVWESRSGVLRPRLLRTSLTGRHCSLSYAEKGHVGPNKENRSSVDQLLRLNFKLRLQKHGRESRNPLPASCIELRPEVDEFGHITCPEQLHGRNPKRVGKAFGQFGVDAHRPALDFRQIRRGYAYLAGKLDQLPPAAAAQLADF